MSRSTRLAAKTAVIAAVALLPQATASASVGKNRFGGNLCKTVSAAALKALKITAPCVAYKPATHTVSTPLGSVTNTVYRARWGTSGGIEDPQYTMSAQAIFVTGSATAVAYLQKQFRGEVLSNGALYSSKPLASEYGDTASCHNPPISDCTHGEIEALVGHYAVTIVYYGPAEFVGEDNPQKPEVDEAHDKAQEEAIKGDFIGAAKEITGAL